MLAFMQPNLRWDDLALLLAIQRGKSLNGAASVLRCDASTVSRRLRTFESSLDALLFDRTPDGLVATDLAHRLLPHAERAEAAVLDASTEAEGTDTRLEGTVRVAIAGGFAAYLLAPNVRSFHDQHPKIRLELMVSTHLVDLTRREADIAVRFVRPTHGDLICKRVPSVGELCVVATKTYVNYLEEGEPLRWIGWVPEMHGLPDAQMLRAVSDEPIAIACNDMVTMVECLRGHAGAMLLPRVILESYSELTEITGYDVPTTDSSTWLVCHRALRDVPRIAATWQWLEALMERALL